MKTIFRSSFSQLIWSILLGLALVPCQAQTIVSGTVVDQQTKETLPFATVHITGTSIGTPTNLEGVFSLIIPEEFAKATLQVSYMGYESQELAIASFSTNQTIGLIRHDRPIFCHYSRQYTVCCDPQTESAIADDYIYPEFRLAIFSATKCRSSVVK